ncbi:MAG: beta-xylosidase [Draconibacterium sp.]|nr:beta-xylosidase [Draconibacterium sp.]
MNKYVLLVSFVIAIITSTGQNKIEKTKNDFDVNIKVDLKEKLGPVNHIWRFFGADEPNYAYMKNGKKLLADLGKLKKKEVFFRTHNLLNTGDGSAALKWGSTNIYTEDKDGKPVYDFTIVDSIFDAYIWNGVLPYVEIGFMPEAMSVKPDPYRHHWDPTLPYDEIFTGWAYPPKDYNKWEELVYQWALHCVERYGEASVEKWYWQTWNEANIPYWKGTPEEFYKLHDYAIHGVKRAFPSAKVGGPDSAGDGGNFTRNFIKHCLTGLNYATGKTGTPMDFVSFHAKGEPTFKNGFVQMNMGWQLSTIEKGFKMIADFPETKSLPIVIGESDPEGCAACQGEQLGYRNGSMYSSYTAASFVRKLDLAGKYGVNLEGALTWAFEFENQPFFAGFRALSTNGINKPVYNVFKMFSMMDGERVAVNSDAEVKLDSIVKNSVRGKADVSAYASFDGERVYIMAWNYHDDDLEGQAASIHFKIENLSFKTGKANVSCYLVDKQHSNSYTKWLSMGSPQNPNEQEYKQLEDAALLEQIKFSPTIPIKNNTLDFDFVLERQGVVMFVLQ